MGLHGHDRKEQLTPCQNERETWDCPNMKPREGDTSMEYEHYDCKICGRHVALDYEETK